MLALDSNVGNGGSVVTRVGSAGYSNYAYAGASDPSGKFVLAGSANSTQDFALTRYNANGTLDTTFGGKSPNILGTVTTDLGGSDQIKGVVVQPDGSIVVAGSSSAGGIYHAVLGRHTATGSLDTTFGGQGTGFSADPFPGNANLFTTLVDAGDGKILAPLTALAQLRSGLESVQCGEVPIRLYPLRIEGAPAWQKTT